MGSTTKVMSVKVKNVTWRFCPFLHLESSDGVSEDCCRFLPSANQEQVSAARLPSTHCHTACRNAGMPSAMLGGDRQMTSLTQLLDRPGQMARKNGAKMTSRSHKKFPEQVSETERVKITLPCFKSLTAADLSSKDDFDQVFNFQGTVMKSAPLGLAGGRSYDRTNSLRMPTMKESQLLREKTTSSVFVSTCSNAVHAQFH